jgi:Ca2+-binding RTX toxin-like protein
VPIYPVPNPNQPVIVGTTATIAPGATNVVLPANITEVIVYATGNLKITKASGDLKVSVIGPGNVDLDLGGVSRLNYESSGSGDSVVKFTDKGGSEIKTAGGDDQVFTRGTGSGTGQTKIDLGNGTNVADLTPKAGANSTRAAGDGFIAYVVKTGVGKDTIRGGNGKLSAYAGAGNDRITGGAGGGRFSGQDGNDRITGGTGKATLLGGDGNDRLTAGKVASTLSGGDGRDTLSSVNGKVDSVKGGAGRDTARAGKRDKVSGVEKVRRSRGN